MTVDDESEIRELLRDILTASGYRVSGAGATVEAMRVVRDDTPHLIITDLQLEESDGVDLVEQVKAVAPKRPIIMLTGVLSEPQVRRRPIGEKIAADVGKTAPLERVVREVRRPLPAWAGAHFAPSTGRGSGRPGACASSGERAEPVGAPAGPVRSGPTIGRPQMPPQASPAGD